MYTLSIHINFYMRVVNGKNVINIFNDDDNTYL